MKLYNSMSRSLEDFEPIVPGKVSMYTCGPTVYNYAHIGNLRTYIHEDILVKTLAYIGYEVNRVMNITDVGHLESDADEGEDKMLKGALRENKTVWEVAAYYTEAFFEDCKQLMIQKPSVVAKATDYIQDYIKFIKGLEAKGYTYFANGNVYFDISKFEGYTKLSKLDLDTLKVAHRDDVEIDVHKKNPQDFVLWFTKSKFENQAMKWESPWGVGYPGWHIECSVISLTNLGDQMDIHCGGVDHIPVHHTNEIAQTEAFTGKDWTKYWWHSEFLVDNSGKMSKSSGEFLTLSLLAKKGFEPLSYRYYVLNSHYRKQLAFSFDSLEMAQSAYRKLKRRTAQYANLEEGIESLSSSAQSLRNNFKKALEDDLNTANAITVLYDVLKSDISEPEKAYLIHEMDGVLSLDLLTVEDSEADVNAEQTAWIEAQIKKRNEAKQSKDWATADAIRDELKSKGIVLIDTPDGVTWKFD
ncbi:cysteine--tRNA ligase [Fusibacter tunisiensis]|uniref:Cysteine--tRNA ligase n=1 Tax=Fusibacter tunisiensis TaxID=1008308 RepID=A0ABS2MRP7_9FIRM|nr:cysteine--tRNA ligase [Fusibacter tunisiensis]MBM7562089.1 cysteinyl-tRNA synthetase [Fusibacter tunisiensis]